jgi:hypothetical protein
VNILLVGGKFDEEEGTSSGYIRKFSEELIEINKTIKPTIINGGNFQILKDLINEKLHIYDVILWFADVPNYFEKIVLRIKTIHPKCILVTSKNNINNKYNISELISRALISKSNLLVEFKKDNSYSRDPLITATILDPLGNCFISNSKYIHITVSTLYSRILELKKFKRIGSVRVGDSIEVPSIDEFFSRVRSMADIFHAIIHSIDTPRFLGNASFRCTNGFPSMKLNDGKICVSRRNIDKRDLNENGFVVVEPNLNGDVVQYYGDHKPSVDTPIHILLYKFYSNIKFIVHSHVYVEDIPITNHIIPCGAIEEFSEIVLFADATDNDFAVNLKGHGSIILVDEISKIDKYRFITRPIPEDISWRG